MEQWGNLFKDSNKLFWEGASVRRNREPALPDDTKSPESKAVILIHQPYDLLGAPDILLNGYALT
ncbi:hypothetical protein D3C73_1534650 [compost metagenome]